MPSFVRPPEWPLTPLSPFCKTNSSVRWTYCWAESVPRKDSLQRNRSNTPSEHPVEHYQRINNHYSTSGLPHKSDDRMICWWRTSYACGFLCFVPSIELSSGVDAFENVEGIFHWESGLLFPKFLINTSEGTNLYGNARVSSSKLRKAKNLIPQFLATSLQPLALVMLTLSPPSGDGMHSANHQVLAEAE